MLTTAQECMAVKCKWTVQYKILSLIQITVLSFLSIDIQKDIHIQPDIILILLVFFGLNKDHIPTILTGFGVGLLIDLMQGGIIGLNSLVKTIVGFITGYLPRQNKIKQIVHFAAIICVFSLVHDRIVN